MGSATALARGNPGGNGDGQGDQGGGPPPDHGGGPPPWAHGQGQQQGNPAPAPPPADPPPAPAPPPVTSPPPAPSPGPPSGDGGSDGHGHGNHGVGNGNGNGNANHNDAGNGSSGHDNGGGNGGTPPGQASHGTNSPPSPTVTPPVSAAAASAPTASVTSTPAQTAVAVPPGLTTPILASAPTVAPTTAPTLLVPGITISSLPFPETTTTRVRVAGSGPGAAGRSVLTSNPLALPSAAAFALLGPSGAQAAQAAGSRAGSPNPAASAGSHRAPAIVHATSSPAATIEHFISVIPLGVWIALAVAIGLAAIGGGAAVAFGRRASRKESEVAAVTAAAVTDQLTGILNRRGFTQSAERELDRARRYGHPLALAFVDVRGLKAVNDSEGHPAGDRLLREVATMLSETARAHDVVGRMGGDELAVLLAEQAGAGAAAMSERIRDHVPEHRAALGLRTRWDVTIGTASFPDDGDTLDELIAAADRRMYEQRGIELRDR